MEKYSKNSSIPKIIKKVLPAVVSIIVSKELQPYNSDSLSFPFDQFFSFPFDQFFQTTPVPQPEQNQAEPEKQKVGGGTGFIISADGLILTNKHVVDDIAADYSVVLSDGTSYEAEVVARDPLNDFAFLRIEAQDLPTVDLGDSDQIQIGQTVIAIGFSLGEYSNTVTKGIISGIGRDIVAGSASGSEKLEGVIQTDAAINPGNSGGPLLNLAGQVIGINTAVNWQGQSLGFAIPINQAKSVIESVNQFGEIIRPWLGVRYVILNKEIAEANKLKYEYGAMVLRGQTANEVAVVKDSPADKAGIVENDIITKINGEEINENNQLFYKACKKLGYKVEQFPVNTRGCQGLGTCNLGCAVHAKQGTAAVQIPAAKKNGVDVFPFCKVEKIKDHDVLVTVSAPCFDQEPSSLAPGVYCFRASKIVLAAGALFSPILLEKSFGNRKWPALGRYFTCHPALILTGEHQRPITNFVGHPKSYYCDEFTESHRFVLETCMYFPFTLAKNICGFGEELDDLMKHYAHLQMILVLAIDEARAENRVRLGRNGMPKVFYQ